MAAQQINLDHPALHRQRVPFSLAQGVLAMAALLLVSAVLGAWMKAAAAREARAVTALQVVAAARPLALGLAAAPASGVMPSPNTAAAPHPAVAELDQLRQLEASQRRVRQALGSGAAGAREGYTELFVALARQAQPGLWITGFTVNADGSALTLEGRMQEADVLPAWLRRLNAEPRLKGRSFAQLQLRTLADVPGLPGPVTEFHLRSQPEAAAPEARP
jgi:Tfp pilus assembly protein PilN